MRGNAQPDGSHLVGVGHNSGPIFRGLWTKVHRIKFAMCGSVRSLQLRFPIDVLLRSEWKQARAIRRSRIV